MSNKIHLGIRYFITGSSGFIGFHLASRLLESGAHVSGYDNMNDYYDTRLKDARLSLLQKNEKFMFYQNDLADKNALENAFAKAQPDIVIHLAGQAGVRYSLTNPEAYVQSNLVGFANILECCRQCKISHLLYASSSSVYGSNTKFPFSESDRVDHPVSLYAATKKSNELMAHVYSHLFHIPTTGLRFFTVYGPYGRPDMAPFLFLKAILAGNPIKVFNGGDMQRDFTYIDDIVDGVLALVNHSHALAPAQGTPPYKIYNIGNSHPEKLADFIAYLEEFTGKTAIKELLPIQPGDVPCTYADTSCLKADTGFQPSTPLREGLKRFVEWYQNFYLI